MTAITNFVDQGFDPIAGQCPEIRWGNTVPDGDAYPWKSMRIGSEWIYIDATNGYFRRYRKAKNDQADNDWVQGIHCIEKTITRAMMTDGGGVSGTYVLAEKIPQGAWVQQTKLVNVTGFTGDTSAVINVGDGSDVDRYNTGNPSVFASANAIDPGVPSGTKIHTAEATITVTITSAADFTNVAAGQLTLQIYYLN